MFYFGKGLVLKLNMFIKTSLFLNMNCQIIFTLYWNH